MADWDEEIKRQAAISTLLAPPEDQSSLDTRVTPESDTAAEHPDKSDWHKLASQIFDQPNISPPPPLNIPTPTPESLPGPTDVKIDPDTGTSYVQDPLEGKIPHAELATASDKEAFKPSDVVLPQIDVSGQGAPVQVKRGEEITEPWHPAGQDLQIPTPTPESPSGPVPKPVPGFIESSKNAILNPEAGLPTVKKAQLVDPDPDSQYLEPAAAPATTPSATPIPSATPVAVTPSPTAAPVTTPTPEVTSTREATTPTPTDQTAIQPTKDDWDKLANSFFPSADSKTKTGVGADTTGQDNFGVADYFRKRGDAPITSENDSRLTQIDVNGSKWNVHSEAAPYFQGFLKELADQGAPMRSDGGWNYRQKVGAKGLSEHSWGGAIDVNQDGRGVVTPAFQQWITDHPGALQMAEQHWHIYGGERFGDLGHFEWGGVGGEGGRDQTPQEPPINTLVRLDQSGINVTHFGYEKPGEEGYDVDSANGNGKYVKDLVPGYDVALNSAGAALVGNPKPGETFQFAGREWRYGDAASEKLKDPRFDIFDPGGNALTGATPVGRQVAAETKEPQSLDDLAKNWVKLTPEEQMETDKGIQAKQQSSLTTLQAIEDQTPNKGDLWKKLQEDIPGVSKDVQQKFKDQFKQQVTDYAFDYYKASNPKITPDEAFKTATSDPDFGTYAGEIWSKILPNFQHAAIAGARAQDVQEENTVNQFFKAVNPDSTAEQRVALKRQIMAMNPGDRRVMLGHMLSGDGDPAVADRMSTIDAPTLFDAFDHISDPVYQTNRKAEIAKAVSQNVKDLTPDPRLAGTPGAIATNLLSSMPKNMLQMGTGILGESSMMQEIYFDTKDQLAKEHPDWDEDKLSSITSASTAAQMGPQIVIMRLGGGALNAATKGIQQPLLELGARLGIHSTVGGLMAGVQQVMKNVTTDRPPMEGVQDAVIVGAAQTGIAAGLHGVISGHGPEVKAPEAEPPPLPVPSTEKPTSEYAPPEPALGVHGPPSDQPGTFEAPIHGEQHGPAFGQLYPEPVEGDEHGPAAFAREGAFTPAELQAKVSELFQDNNYSPEELQAKVEQLQPEPVLQPEIARGLAPAPEPITLPQAIKKAKADAVAAQLGGTTRVVGADERGNVQTVRTGRTSARVTVREMLNAGGDSAVAAQTALDAGHGLDDPMPKPVAAPLEPSEQIVSKTGEPPPTRVTESEPFTSKIANRYTAERMATGELGTVDPSQGKSTEEMVAHGLKMSPESRERMIDNFSRGVGGDLDDQGAAIRSKEALLSVQSTEAGRAAEADPTNVQLKANADAALKAATDFHNGPVKKFKRVWSDAGRGLQREVPLDYSTLNGMKEAYMKGAGNGKEAPPEMEPKLKQTAVRVKKSAADEETAINNLGGEIGKRTRGKTLPDNDSIRAKLMKIMGDLPCRN